LIGLKGVVVKSHGGADVMGFSNALAKAYAEASEGVLERIATRMAAAHAASPGFGGNGGCSANSNGTADA
jgi:glycerol-3-phosphate acyltransferase PlsX